MDNSNRLFRKAAFGGFNKEDVMRYIETMKTEFFDYKAQVEETINELNEQLSSLQQPMPASAQTQTDNANPALSINEATDRLRQVADELLCNLNLLLGRLHLQEAGEAVGEEEQLLPLEEPKEPTAQDKVESLLNTLFSPAENEADQPAKQTAPAAKPDLSSVLPNYLNF